MLLLFKTQMSKNHTAIKQTRDEEVHTAFYQHTITCRATKWHKVPSAAAPHQKLDANAHNQIM